MKTLDLVECEMVEGGWVRAAARAALLIAGELLSPDEAR
jgi:hypothetical protein